MGAIVDVFTGGGARKQAAMAAEAQARQQAALDAEKAKTAKIEAGQRANAQRGGGGLLAYVDDPGKLKQTLG